MTLYIFRRLSDAEKELCNITTVKTKQEKHELISYRTDEIVPLPQQIDVSV
jgi:hypothetical protein